MAQTGYTPIVAYHSTTAAATPTAGNLVQGELALNVTDKKIFTKDGGGNVVTIGEPNDPTTLVDADIGVTVQGYDADTAKLDADQTWTGAQRGTLTTDNDGSFDQNVSNKFKCTPTGAVAITFTNHTAGQGGTVIFVNTTNYAITAAATTYIAAADLTKLSTTGSYLIGYEDDGTNTYCTVSAALTSAGA